MNCPICGSALQESGVSNKIYQQDNLYCNACDSFHIAHQIDDKAYYENEYHDNFHYKQPTFKYRMVRLLPSFAYRPTARYDYLKKHIPLNKHARFIEIGGGSGENYLVFDSLNRAEKYIVVEPGDAFVQKGHNLRHIADILENVSVSDLGASDIVMMFHVLEHIFDLDSFFQKLQQMDFKYFYFEVPNIANDVAKLDSLVDNPHYHHFSVQSINLLAQKFGFETISADGVSPRSYHPFKKVGAVKKYILRLLHKNEYYPEADGMYLRCILKKKI